MTDPKEKAHREALGLVEKSIEKVRGRGKASPYAQLPTLGELFPNGFEIDPEGWRGISRWAEHIESWLLAWQALGGVVEYGWVRSWVMKPWLQSIVGFEAINPFGQAAGMDGYDMLVAEGERLYTEAEERRAAATEEAP